MKVALRKESVDRNSAPRISKTIKNASLSARRAWIEMLAARLVDMSAAVALRKESVDRNPKLYQALSHVRVALRKESVDRNYAL